VKFKLLYINDLHGRYEEFAKIASIIHTLKDINTLFLDAGDNVDLAGIETIGTNGKISSEILNEFGCVARVLGHCEVFSGKEVIESICKSSNFPVITCNIYDIKGRKLKGLEDYTIFTLGDLRVLIIGVTIPYNEFYNLFNLIDHTLYSIKTDWIFLKWRQSFKVCLNYITGEWNEAQKLKIGHMFPEEFFVFFRTNLVPDETQIFQANITSKLKNMIGRFNAPHSGFHNDYKPVNCHGCSPAKMLQAGFHIKDYRLVSRQNDMPYKGL